MKRRPNWDAELVRFVRRQLGQPWAWGHTDCCSLVRGALAAMYGEDVAPGVPGWDSLATAAALQRDTGGVAAVLERELGATRVPSLRLARSGDIAIGPGGPEDFADSAFIVVGAQAYSCNPDGHVRGWPLAELPADVYVLRVPALLGPDAGVQPLEADA